MSSVDHNAPERIDVILAGARSLPSDQVAAYLDQVCGSDSRLRVEIQRMLEELDDCQGEPFNSQIMAQTSGVQGAPAPAQAKDRAARITDRNMLFGILALQLNLVSQQALVKAMQVWVQSKNTPIEHFLHRDAAIGSDAMKLLQVLVDQHVDNEQGEVTASVLNMESATALREELGAIPDRELLGALTEVRGDSSTKPGGGKTGQQRPAVSANRFRVLKFYKSGGMGKVSLAHDQELNREVAFKEVKDRHANDPEYQSRLVIEAEITGGLEHPGIVPVYGLGTDQAGRPFYAMRFVQGSSLGEAISEFREQQSQWSAGRRSLEFRRLLKRFIDVCEAIHYAHHRQVLHRDLKPDNIMLGRYGETLVLDWGLAKALGTAHYLADPEADQPLMPHSGDSAAPTTDGTIGTPNYMSPEQANNEEVGPATDIFSLGGTLYRLLCGQPPYMAKDKEREFRKLKTLELARQCQFPMPREVDKDVPPALEAICLKAMRREPQQRYSTSQALADDVERWLADEPVTAYRDPWEDRFFRWVRRHRTAVVGGSAVLVTALLAAMLLGTIAQRNYVREAQLNTQLSKAQQQAEADFATTRQLAFALVAEAEDTLSQQPGMEDERRILTNMALTSFQELYERRGENEPLVQHDLTRLYVYAANLDRFHGDYASAVAKYAGALKILRLLTETNPADLETRQRLIATLVDYTAMLLDTGQITPAEEPLLQAEQLIQSLGRDSNESALFQYFQALASGLRAIWYHEKGQLALALEKRREEASLLSLLLPQSQRPEEILALQIFAVAGQSRVLSELNRVAEAREVADRGVILAAAGLAEDAPRYLRHASAHASLELARVLEASQDAELKWQHLHQARDTWNTLSKQFPDTVYYSQFLALTQALIAAELLDRGENSDAIKQYQAARSMLNQLMLQRDNPGVLVTCAQVLELGANHPSLVAPDEPGKYRQQAIDQVITAQDRSSGSVWIGMYLEALREGD